MCFHGGRLSEAQFGGNGYFCPTRNPEGVLCHASRWCRLSILHQEGTCLDSAHAFPSDHPGMRRGGSRPSSPQPPTEELPDQPGAAVSPMTRLNSSSPRSRLIPSQLGPSEAEDGFYMWVAAQTPAVLLADCMEEPTSTSVVFELESRTMAFVSQNFCSSLSLSVLFSFSFDLNLKLESQPLGSDMDRPLPISFQGHSSFRPFKS